MKFKTLYFKEDVEPSARAYWLSPSKDIIPVDSVHIETILSNIDQFGLTQEYIDEVAEKHGGKHELRDGGKAREEIMIDVMKKGWVRVRKNRETWVIQLDAPTLNSKISRTQKNAIVNWAEKLMEMNPSEKNSPVVVLDLDGRKLFGGGMLYKDQKTIQDIYMDDTGVFESLFINDNIITE
jgi:hypothetical protein